MTQSQGAIGISTYQVSSQGQRVRKSGAGGDTVFHYDAQGRLIAETSSTGTLQKEYLYLGDLPVAVIQ
jgi:YD repeat-containing protein